MFGITHSRIPMFDIGNPIVIGEALGVRNPIAVVSSTTVGNPIVQCSIVIGEALGVRNPIAVGSSTSVGNPIVQLFFLRRKPDNVALAIGNPILAGDSG